MGIGGHIHVEVVTEKIAFPMGVPSPVAVRLGIQAFAAAGRTAIFLTIADPFFPLLSGSPYRGAIASKSHMVWVDQSFLNRTSQELLLIETENKGKRIFWFQVPAFQQREKPGSCARRITGSLIAFLFPFGRLPFRETILGRKVVPVILPDAGKEIIKSPDTRSIPERESAEDGIKRSFPEHAAPDRDGSHFELQRKQVGAQHAGREAWFWSQNRVALLHNGIRKGKIKKPELHDIVPGTFGKNKGIRIELKEIGYKGILIGGMTARITR